MQSGIVEFFLAAAAVLSLLGLVSATHADKARLCYEVCWTWDINNLDSCYKGCLHNEEHTNGTAKACRNCIENCLAKHTHKDQPEQPVTADDIAYYRDCRMDCLQNFAPEVQQVVMQWNGDIPELVAPLTVS